MFRKRRCIVKKIDPVQVIAGGFAGIILGGGILLSLPFFSTTKTFTPLIDALFTAASATCVTGLATLNTAEHWNGYGQLLILLLIELGGLGFMMLPILFYTITKKKVTLSTRILLKESLNLQSVSGTMSLTLYILRLAFVIQALGVLLLSVDLIPRYGIQKGLWYALFHAVSSFCNAGFDLFGDSLISFQHDSYLLIVVSFLIISGGLGFIVWRDVLQFFHGKHLSLHSKIALPATVILLVAGTGLFMLTESGARQLVADNTAVSGFINSFFMSVTARTAGYYSIDYGTMTEAGLVVTMFLMYIGGTSGSTAGGLKTTTFGVLWLQIFSLFRGRTRAEFAGRSIKENVVFRALTLFFITLSLCVTASMILAITETIPVDKGIEYIAFEVFSAFGTVGLSMGLTPDLTFAGKLIIICLMYIGRVGVMTVLFSLLRKSQQQEVAYRYPEESLMIG